jgi:hypothetical protein
MFAFVSSTLWEYVGEIREHAAVNDMIATPVTGMALGEPMLQLGALAQRGTPGAGSTAAGWIFAPFKSLHDAIDGLEPETARDRDHLGLPADVWHRVTIGGGAGVTAQRGGLVQTDGRFFAESRIVAIPGYGAAATRHGWFDDGEVTELRIRTAVASGNLVDAGFGGHVLPLGYAFQDVARDDRGRLRGHGGLVGMHVGAEYGVHDWDRDRRRDRDRIAFVATGLTIEERIHAGDLTLRARVDGLATFAGVDAYALPAETTRWGSAQLSSVMRNQHYYHAYGATLRPRLELEVGPIDAGGEACVDWFSSIDVRDVDATDDEASLDASDRRVRSRVFVGVRPAQLLRLSLSAEYGARHGRVGATRDARSETGLHSAIEIVF